MKNVNYAQFSGHLSRHPLVSSPVPLNYDVDTYWVSIEHLVISELDKVAPVKCCKRKVRTTLVDAFISSEAISAKRQRRKLERHWILTGSETVQQQYRAACCAANYLINSSRADFLSNCINSANNGSKLKWR